jgi:hypothetical protein
MRAKRDNPVGVRLLLAGKPTVTEAQFPSGKASAGGPKSRASPRVARLSTTSPVCDVALAYVWLVVLPAGVNDFGTDMEGALPRLPVWVRHA